MRTVHPLNRRIILKTFTRFSDFVEVDRNLVTADLFGPDSEETSDKMGPEHDGEDERMEGPVEKSNTAQM